MEENLQTNPFFAALLDHIPHLEKSCVKESWTLCIPQVVALPESHRLSLRLLKNHILVPKQGTVNEFVTLSGTTVRRVNEKELEVDEKDGKKRTVNILYKEDIYCGLHGEERYGALCLSRALEGEAQVPVLDDGTEVFSEDRGAEAWLELLTRDEYDRKKLQSLEHRIAAFEDPLVVIKNECRAYTEIRMFAEKMCKERCVGVFEPAMNSFKYRAILQCAWETCATVAVHGILFAALSDANASSENDVQLRLHDLREMIFTKRKSCDRFGLTAPFLKRFQHGMTSKSFLASVEILQSLNEKKSPLEKLWCLRDSSRALREIPENDNLDEALPIFLLALISAAPGLLLANLSYMIDFGPRSWVKTTGELSFHCTVFNSAVSLIQEHVPEQEEQSLLKNFIVAGGSGLGVSWISGAPGTRKQSKNSASGFNLFESCVPQSRS